MGHEATVLLEGVCILQFDASRGGEAHVRNKGARFLRLRFARKAPVLVSGYKILVNFWGAVELEGADACAVGVLVALVGEAVRRLQ